MSLYADLLRRDYDYSQLLVQLYRTLFLSMNDFCGGGFLFCFLFVCFFVYLSLFTTQFFKGITFWQKLCKQKNKGVPFHFLARAPQTLATPLRSRRHEMMICTYASLVKCFKGNDHLNLQTISSYLVQNC